MVRSEVIYVKDMMCRQCEKTLEHAVAKVSGVLSVKADYSIGKITVSCEENCSRKALEEAIIGSGYQPGKKQNDGVYTALLLMGIIAAFYCFKRAGLPVVFASFPQAEQGMGYAALFVVGLLTSVHCVAMCGGLNLSQSLKDGSSVTGAAVSYNLGRLCSYTLIGGLLGILGSVFSISVKLRAGIGLLAGICMLFMALNMLNLVPFLRVFRIPVQSVRGKSGERKNGSSFCVGLFNGLMPCGPLQSMQLLAVTTGSAVKGAASMFFFCLGTIPLMLFVGLAAGIVKQKWREKMLLAGSILILIFSVNMIQNNVALLGFGKSVNTSDIVQAEVRDGVQYVTTELEPNRYKEIEVLQNIPVKWTIIAEESSLNGCNNEIRIPEYDLDVKLQPGENIIEFVPEESGIFPYSCWMGMIRSSIVVA